MMPLCTTRFLQFLQQEQAWLHSKISGGSILLNSCSNRPSWMGCAGGGWWLLCGAQDPQDAAGSPALTPEPGPIAPRPETRKHSGQEPDLHTPGKRPRPRPRPAITQAGGSWQGLGRWQLHRAARPGVVGTHLVIPAPDAELAAQAVGAGAVVHARAVLRQEWSQHPKGGLATPRSLPGTHILGQGW